MRLTYLIVSPLLLLAGCATDAAGSHAHDAQAMRNCRMMSSSTSGDQQGAMTGDRSGMMGQGPMMQGQMMQGQSMQGQSMQGMQNMQGMANCPMAQGGQTPSAQTEPHQH